MWLMELNNNWYLCHITFNPAWLANEMSLTALAYDLMFIAVLIS